jgi:hypothetical protein
LFRYKINARFSNSSVGLIKRSRKHYESNPQHENFFTFFIKYFKDGKWKITHEEWPWNDYPPYFLGAAVLLPGSTILPLLAACQTIPMMPFDDLYIFGLCTEKADITTRFSFGTNRYFVHSFFFIIEESSTRSLTLI